MNISKKFLVLGLLLGGLQVNASSKGFNQQEEDRKIREMTEDFRRHTNVFDALAAPFSAVAEYCTSAANIALIPGQMLMAKETACIGDRKKAAEICDAFKKSQFERCKTCTAATCLCLGAAGTLYAVGYPIISGSPVEASLTGAALTAGCGYATTCCPCTYDASSSEHKME